jgi:hypothetical protein
MFIKKGFPVFLRRLVRLCIQSLEKIKILANKFVFKNSLWLSKNAEFHADFKSIEKVLKNVQKKLLTKK